MQLNSQGYSTRAGASIHAFGMSSISQTETTYRQNSRELADYYAAIVGGRLPIERALLLKPEDRRRRTIIMRLMCGRRLDHAALPAALGLDFAQTYATELDSLADLIADGLLVRSATGHDVTPIGSLFIRIIAMRFDAHLAASPARYSRTV